MKGQMHTLARRRGALGAKVALVALAASLCAPVSAQATPAEEDQADTPVIIVTATRRNESLQDVTIAMTAFSAEELERRGATRFADVTLSVPNVVYEQVGDVRNARISIRGISANQGFIGSESAVGVIVDGVFVSGAPGLSFDLPDIEQVEVLRGPQGTLYGRNTAAGVINIRTRKPDTSEFSGSAVAEYGNYDHLLLNAYLSAPVIEDKLAVSLAYIHKERDGFDLNIQTGDRINDVNTDALRGQVLFTPDASTEFRLIGEYVSDDYFRQVADEIPSDRQIPRNSINPTTKRDIYAASFSASHTLPSDISLRGLVSWRSIRANELNDGDPFTLPTPALFRGNDETSKEWTAELQITSPDSGRFKWLVGAFFLDQNLLNKGRYGLQLNTYWDRLVAPAFGGFSLRNALSSPAFGGSPAYAASVCTAPAPNCTGDANGLTQTAVDFSFDTRSYALFGNASYDISEKLTAEFGLRLSRDERQYSYTSALEAAWPFPPGSPLRQVFIAGPETIGFVPLPVERNIAQTILTPKFALRYKFNDDLTTYASATRGYKSGTFLGNILGVSDANQNGINDNIEFLEVDEETSWNYELGLKGNIDNTVAFSLAAFYLDYNGLQTQRQLFQVATQGNFNFLGNADTEVYGFEAEASVRIADPLTLSGAFGYSHSKFTDYTSCALIPANPITGTPATVDDCTGNRLPYAPLVTASARLDYVQPISDTLQVTALGEWTYRGAQFFDTQNLQREDSFSLLNATVGIGDPDGRWNVSLWGRNLTNKDYATFIAPPAGGLGETEFLGAPRTYGIRTSFKF